MYKKTFDIRQGCPGNLSFLDIIEWASVLGISIGSKSTQELCRLIELRLQSQQSQQSQQPQLESFKTTPRHVKTKAISHKPLTPCDTCAEGTTCVFPVNTSLQDWTLEELKMFAKQCNVSVSGRNKAQLFQALNQQATRSQVPEEEKKRDSDQDIQAILAQFQELSVVPTRESTKKFCQTKPWMNLTKASLPWSERQDADQLDFLDQVCVRECGGGGDCLFHAIAYGLNQNYRFTSPLTAQSLRNTTAFNISKENVDDYLDEYIREQKQKSLPSRSFDPLAIARNKNVNDRVTHLQRVVSTPGFSYQGDDLSLKLLSHSAFFKENKLGFLVIKDNGFFDCKLYPSDLVSEDFLVLYNISDAKMGGHWKLAGVDSGHDVQTLFTRENFPEVLKNLFLLDCHEEAYNKVF